MNIPPPPRVVRWLIQVIWLPMVALLSALLAVFFVIAVLLWPIDRKFRTARVIALVLAFLWIDAGLITGCFYIWLKWIVKGNFRERGPQWRLEHEELLLDALNGIMEHAHKWVGLRVEFEEPMDFGLEEAPLLAFPRHAGPGGLDRPGVDARGLGRTHAPRRPQGLPVVGPRDRLRAGSHGVVLRALPLRRR